MAAVASAPAALRRRPRRALIALTGLVVVAIVAVVLVAGGSSRAAGDAGGLAAQRPHPQAVEPIAGVALQPDTGQSSAPLTTSSLAAPAPAVRPGESATAGLARPSDAEVQRELSLLKQAMSVDGLTVGPRAAVRAGGVAVAPLNAPLVVKEIIQAGNEIARFPYKWGGGHSAWRDNGYDCSGSVSFALAAAGLLDRPLTSGELAASGLPGPGRWVTIYANPTHVWMVVAGLRFDTVALAGGGTRWSATMANPAGFSVRHPPGL